jgi:hypothetical protein
MGKSDKKPSGDIFVKTGECSYCLMITEITVGSFGNIWEPLCNNCYQRSRTMMQQRLGPCSLFRGDGELRVISHPPVPIPYRADRCTDPDGHDWSEWTGVYGKGDIDTARCKNCNQITQDYSQYSEDIRKRHRNRR